MTPLQSILRKWARVERALLSLSGTEVAALRGVFIDGSHPQRSAARAGVSPAEIDRRLASAKRKLRAALASAGRPESSGVVDGLVPE